MFPSLKNYAAASYKGPVKIELMKGVGLLFERGDYIAFSSLVVSS